MASSLRDFLEIPYEQLEELNLAAKAQRAARTPIDTLREERLKYLTDEKGIKAVTVAFSDLEGRLHTLDYDKKFLVDSADNLTFDGSSIRGFSQQVESDLRLSIDWGAFYWLPADIFGPGKVFVFGDVLDRDGTAYSADLRARLKQYTNDIYEKDGLTCNVATETEGFLFQGRDAEQVYRDKGYFDLLSPGGYYHTLPSDPLRLFIDAAAEALRAMGFKNEKDHPEVAPSQFEINYSYAEALIAADQIVLYKLLCRQIAASMGMTASFLPKPLTGVNGNGMHTNMSLSKNGENLFYDANGPEKLSEAGWNFVDRILSNAKDLCLVLNSSVNSYRRLDPHYEAPNQIKASAIDRGSMIRIPLGNRKSARIEVRSVAPDANPYMSIYSLLRTGLEGPNKGAGVRAGEEVLFDNIYDAVQAFQGSEYISGLLGESVQGRYAELKANSADRCPRKLGSLIKRAELQFHHEIYNQSLWNRF